MEIRDTEGHCNVIEPMKVSRNNSKYEGRWFIAYAGLTKEQTKRVTCTVWDSFFDETGQIHTFVTGKDNGEVKVSNGLGTPLIAEKRTYRYYYDPSDTKSFMVNTYYYIDDEMVVWFREECFSNKNTKHQFIVVGYRNLEDVKKNEGKLNLIVKMLEAEGGHPETNLIRHEKCDYPAKMQDPFKAKKAAKLAKEKEEEKEKCLKEKFII